MSSQIAPARPGATRRLAAALALAAVVTLGVSVAAPTDAASAASTSTRTYSAEGGASAPGSVAVSDRQQPSGRLYIPAAYFEREQTAGPLAKATDICSAHHLGNWCITSLEKLFLGPLAKSDECQYNGMDAVIPNIKASRCRRS